MKYTTVENIARRLRGRLNINVIPGVDDSLGYGTAVAGNTVDSALITQLADEKEAYIDLILSQIYVTPLRLSSDVTVNILRDISECLTISALMQVHFEGTNPVLQASDAGQASMDLRRHAEFLLQAICAGTNIWIPTTPTVDTRNLDGQRQPLRLPGEVLLGQSDIPDTITRNYTVTSKKSLPSEDISYFQEEYRIRGTENNPTYFN
jgi:hypothetical protein